MIVLLFSYSSSLTRQYTRLRQYLAGFLQFCVGLHVDFSSNSGLVNFIIIFIVIINIFIFGISSDINLFNYKGGKGQNRYD